MEQDKRCLNFHIRINYFSFFTKLLDCSRDGSINSLNVSSSPDFWQWLENRSLSIIYFSKLNFLISRQQVKKYRVSFFPPPPLFPWPKSAHTLFKLPFPRAFHFRNHHSQMDGPPARFAPFPPLKSFSRLCSTNWVATMTVSFHPQCSSVCEYTLEPRDRSDGAHISRLGGCKTAHIHGADDSTVWPECVPDTLLYCAVGGWLTPPPTPDNVSRLGAVF